MPWWRKDPLKRIAKIMERDEHKEYRSLEELRVFLKERQPGEFALSNLVAHLERHFDAILEEIEQEAARLGVLRGEFEQFIHRDKVRLSTDWSGDRTWGEVGGQLTRDLQQAFREKQKWIKDLKERWREEKGSTVHFNWNLTDISAQQIQNMTLELFKALRNLEKTEKFRRYDDFKKQVLDPIHTIAIGFEAKKSASETLARRRA